MIDIIDKSGRITKQVMRTHFERVVNDTPTLKVNTPLAAMTLNGEFSLYTDPDTDTMWLGFALGMRCAERVAAATTAAPLTEAQPVMTSNHPGLLPCPFCGGAAEFDELKGGESGGHFIICTNSACMASSNIRYACGDDPLPLLAEQWNRRAAQSVTLTGHQLKAAMEFVAPDVPQDPDQLESELTIADLPSRMSNEGEPMPAGMYAWFTEYPEEGCIPLFDVMPPSQDVKP